MHMQIYPYRLMELETSGSYVTSDNAMAVQVQGENRTVIRVGQYDRLIVNVPFKQEAAYAGKPLVPEWTGVTLDWGGLPGCPSGRVIADKAGCSDVSCNFTCITNHTSRSMTSVVRVFNQEGVEYTGLATQATVRAWVPLRSPPPIHRWPFLWHLTLRHGVCDANCVDVDATALT